MCMRSSKSDKGTMSEEGVGDSAPIGLTEMLKVLVEDRQWMEREHVEVRAEECRRHEEQMKLMRRRRVKAGDAKANRGHGECAEVGETYRAI